MQRTPESLSDVLSLIYEKIGQAAEEHPRHQSRAVEWMATFTRLAIEVKDAIARLPAGP